MNPYDIFMYPLEKRFLKTIRRKCIPVAKGKVLEIGIGTGANLPFYKKAKITGFTGLDVKIAKSLQQKADSDTKFLTGSVENLPFENDTFDTVVATLVLCSVTDLHKSLAEIYRVLKPSGRYIFIEHILPQGPCLSSFFNSVNGPWSKLSNGCNLNRRTNIQIEALFSQTKSAAVAKGVFYYGVAKK